MMTPGIFGGMSALCLGTADFMSRFSSRAIDHYNALLGMLIVGSLLMTILVIGISGIPSLEELAIGWIAANGFATMAMTLLFPFDSSRWFRCDIIDYSINTSNRIYNSIGYFC